MSDLLENRRDAGAFIAAEHLRHVPSLVFLLIGLSVWDSRAEGVARTLFLSLIIVLGVSRLLGPVLQWATVRYTVTTDGVRVTGGLLHRRTTSLRWSTVRAVDVEDTWSLRLFGLHRVTLAQAGGDATRVVFRAVDDKTRRLLTGLASGAGAVPLAALADDASTRSERTDAPAVSSPDASPPPAAPPATPPTAPTAEAPTERVVYEASLGELVRISLMHGTFAVLAPAVLMTVWELASSVGLAGAFESAAAGLDPRVAGLLVFCAAVVLGIVATVVRFHGFRATSTPSALVVAYGLVERKQRTLHPTAVQGVIVHRNLMEQLLGRARLSVLTVDASTRLGANVVMPSIPVRVVSSVLQEHFPDFATPLHNERSAVRVLRSSVLLTAVSVGVPVAVFVAATQTLGTEPGWAAVLAFAALGTLRGVGAPLASRLTTDPAERLVVLTTRFTYDRRTVADVGRLHGVMSWAIPGRRTGRTVLVTAFLYAGAPRRLAAAHCATSTLEALRSRLAAPQPRAEQTIGRGAA